MAYFDENGNEVKGLLTEEEVKEKLAEEQKVLMEEAAKAKVEAEAAVAAAKAEADAVKAQIEAAKQAPAGGDGQQSQSDKEENLAALRKKLEETQAAVEAERTQMTERLTALEGDKVNQAISAIAAGNEDLAAKIRHNYDTTLSGVKATTAEEISAKVQNAVKLSTNMATPNPLDAVIPGAAQPVGTPKTSTQPVEFNQNEVALGSKLGISDADRAKYGDRIKNMNTK
jgi:membrane protein involved in colicin uptake